MFGFRYGFSPRQGYRGERHNEQLDIRKVHILLLTVVDGYDASRLDIDSSSSDTEGAAPLQDDVHLVGHVRAVFVLPARGK